MVFANNKFLLRMENELWNSPTESDRKIIALEAQVDALKTWKTAPVTNSNNNSVRRDNKWAWKAVRPKEGELRKKRSAEDLPLVSKARETSTTGRGKREL
jgi:hypothetical protein